ncbi:Uncharacterised protein [Mycobacteroides abscessus subsp. abscessus]|nr:Uncharacterised protein [Mycobacteroides abscessus subsp. abscessus]
MTAAPLSCNSPATFSAGESRTSSDSGLNAAPSTATLAPSSDPPHALVASSTMRVRRRMLMLSTSRRKVRA